MALIVEKRSPSNLSLEIPQSLSKSSDKRWCSTTASADPSPTILIPFTEIDKLRISFPDKDDKVACYLT